MGVTDHVEVGEVAQRLDGPLRSELTTVHVASNDLSNLDSE